MGLGFVIALSLYLLGFAFMTYACIVADPATSPTARFMTQRIPQFFFDKIQKLLGNKVLDQLQAASEYALQVIYLVVVLGSWSIMFAYGYPMVRESKHVSTVHTYVGYLIFILCMGSWRYACRTGPGVITERTIPKFDNYPYDNLLFRNHKCPTLHIRKLARSKYDRFTHRHIPRFDHYCGWVGQPVGEENYKHFLLFLLVHVGMCWYGSIITSKLFLGEIHDRNLLNAVFFNAVTGKEVKASWTVIFHYLLYRHFYLAGVLLLMSVMAVILTAFLAYHLYITARGMTTNEFYKWRQVRKWHKQEMKKYKRALKDGLIDENGGPIMGSSASESTSNGEKSNQHSVKLNDDVDVGCTGPTTAPGGAVPMALNETTDDCGNIENELEDIDDKVIMNPGPMPKNIYDLGIIENIKEVIFPRSLRQDALDRWAESLKRNGNSIPVEVEGKSKAS